MVGAAIVALVMLVGCSKQLDVAKPERAIAREVERGYGVTVRKVTCPKNLSAKRGARFQCLVELTDDRLTVNVTQTDSKGGLTFKLGEQILTRRSVATAINQQYKSNFVDCGKRTYWVSRPRRTFRCTAKDDAGNAGTIVVTIRDTLGNIDLDFAQ
ncbi:MAG: hypothetical protein QOI55_1444 [Actinomycetota bacterium]|jgi:hypothetical protein|nr:hypothetical protein [Actinomycetota bacterium]